MTMFAGLSGLVCFSSGAAYVYNIIKHSRKKSNGINLKAPVEIGLYQNRKA